MSKETKFELKDKMDNHLIKNDTFLRAILDVAEMGRNEAEECQDEETCERFNVILDLLTMYRERNTTFIDSLYKPLDMNSLCKPLDPKKQDSKPDKAA